MKKIFLFCILILFTGLFGNEKHHFITTDFFNTTVNWAKYQVSLTVSEELPRVTIDTDDPEFGKQNTALNNSEARNKALLVAKEKIKIHMVRSIENMRFDNEYTILEKVYKDEKFREKFNEFFLYENGEMKVKYVQDRIIVESGLKLLGEKGLLGYLDIEYGTEEFPGFGEIPVPESYTGLIVDARHLDGVPSLFPKIHTDKGLDIYSRLKVLKNFAADRGIVSFLNDPSIAMKDPRVGNKPFYTVAINTTGKNNSNFSIQTKDAVKLFSSKQTIKNLKKCNVIILLKK